MKSAFIPLVFMLSISFATQVFSQDPVPSEITSVTVFQDTARINRSTNLTLVPGNNLVRIGNVSSRIDSRSVTVQISPVGDYARVREVGVEPADENRRYSDMEELKAEIFELESRIIEIQSLEEFAKKRIEFAEEMAESFAENYGSGGASFEDAQQVWDQVVDVASQMQDAIKEYEQQLIPLRDQLEIMQNQLDDLRNNWSQRANDIYIIIESQRQAQVELNINYLVSGCYWNAIYELRATPRRGTLELSYRASIMQNSGEPWNNVVLTLSTRQARAGSQVPELDPIPLNEILPPPVPEGGEEAVMMAPMALDAAPSSMKASRDMRFAQPTVDAGFASFEMNLPQTFSIASSRRPVSVSVRSFSLNAQFYTEIVPKIEESGYLIAETRNTTGFPLLPGEMNTYVEGKLIGKGFLDAALPDVPLKISMGVDENIIVTREDGELNQSTTGIVGRNKQFLRQYFTRVENLHPFSHPVVVVDQFPISRNSKIRVDRIMPQFGEETTNPEINTTTGIFKWRDLLNLDETRVYETQFVVTYPSDWRVREDY